MFFCPKNPPYYSVQIHEGCFRKIIHQRKKLLPLEMVPDLQRLNKNLPKQVDDKDSLKLRGAGFYAWRVFFLRGWGCEGQGSYR